MFFIQVCEAARLNFAELVKFLKKGCRCKTKLCQNWECTCIRDDDTGELGDCVCPACDCMSCTSCQVQTLFTKRLKYCFNHWYVSPQQHGIFSFYIHRWRWGALPLFIFDFKGYWGPPGHLVMLNASSFEIVWRIFAKFDENGLVNRS